MAKCHQNGITLLCFNHYFGRNNDIIQDHDFLIFVYFWDCLQVCTLQARFRQCTIKGMKRNAFALLVIIFFESLHAVRAYHHG